MKKTTIGMVLLCAILLGSCTKDAEMKNEALPQNTETTMEEFVPMTFEQTRALVGEVLGSDVAERIEPTSRYVQVLFRDVNTMLDAVSKSSVVYLPAPAPEYDAPDVTLAKDQPAPLYAVVGRDVTLPEDAECNVLAEFFDPASPLSGLTEEQAEIVIAAIGTRTTRAVTPWKPSGKIEMKDDVTDEYLPIPNARIKLVGYKAEAPTIMLAETLLTNSAGEFSSTKQYVGPVSAVLEFSNDSWAVLKDNANVAAVGTMLTSSPWNLIISYAQTGPNIDYASAFMAANYMHRNGYRLTDGTSNSFISICCFDESVPVSSDDSFIQDGSSNRMKVLLYCADKTPLEIRTTAQREIGKAVQRLKVNAENLDYTIFSPVNIQSWGEFTKYYFTEKFYDEELDALTSLHSYRYVPAYKSTVAEPDDLNGQAWYYDSRYSAYNQCRCPMFIDLYDNFDQNIWPDKYVTATVKYPNDKFYMKNSITFTLLEELSYTLQSPLDIERYMAQNIGMTRDQQGAMASMFAVYLALDNAL